MIGSRVPLPAVVVAFAAYAYGATTVSAAWFLRRDLGLGVSESLVWAALTFSPWVAVGLLVWLVLRIMGAEVRTIIVLLGLAAPVVPVAALAATAVARAMHQADWSGAEIIERAVDRLPVAILLYTALIAAGLATAYWRRAERHAREMQALALALQHARTAQAAGPEQAALIVSVGRRRLPVQAAEVEWLSSAGNYVVVHWRDQEGLLRETLGALEGRLGPDRFARCHRSTLINLARVAELRPLADGAWRATMDSGAELVISRTYRDALLARLGRR